MGINLPRKLFHLFFSLFLYFLFVKLDKKSFQIFLVGSFIFLTIWEILRLKKPSLLPFKNLWKKLLKEREFNEFTDAFFYLLGIIVATLIAPYSFVGSLILVLGISDPLAEFMGKLFKGKRLFREKTLSGSLAFFFSSLFIIFWQFKGLSLILIIFSVNLTLIELFTKRDNFWIPFSGALFTRFFLTS
ncbi:MAG: hypothetical protein ACP5HI_00605 [Caldimicrobium sp.]|jgi:dolichol kinase